MPLADAIRSAPLVHDAEMAERALRELRLKGAQSSEAAGIAALLGPDSEAGATAAASPALALVTGIFGASPYLSRLITTNPAELVRCLNAEPLDYLRQSAATLTVAIAECRRHEEAMEPLRGPRAPCPRNGACRSRRRLGCRSGDGGAVGWRGHAARGGDPLLLSGAALTGRLSSPPTRMRPRPASGYIVLGMGKYGARELNYSSDIDLIVFYDADKRPVARRPGATAPSSCG